MLADPVDIILLEDSASTVLGFSVSLTDELVNEGIFSNRLV